jgi:hypothetical protein
MSENNHRGATDQAADAGQHLRDAAGQIGDAYKGAYEQAILGIAGLKDGTAGSAAWLGNAGAPIGADELAQAGKQIGRAYIDAHERAALIAIDLRERLAAATNADWIKSMASTQAALERDAVNTCFSLARGLLT